VAEQLDAADPVCYCATVSRREREAGLEGSEKVTAGCMNANVRDVMSLGGASLVGEPKPIQKRANHHPTVKPLHLTRYLATLLLPPAEYAPRRIFCPFAGVASEMIGAMQAGWEEVVGVEREAEYVAIGKARIKHYTHSQGQLL